MVKVVLPELLASKGVSDFYFENGAGLTTG